jgi:hypothetical protein
MSLLKQRVLVFLFPLLLALPFLNRALFVDDHFFVEIAQWIKGHPTDPFSFPVDGIAPSAHMPKTELLQRIVNPLLHHYYLALWMKIGGEREAWLRLGGVLPVCAAGLFLFSFARRWTQHPLLATLLAQATPAHWLTSYSLLIDATLFFFVLAGLWSFAISEERDSISWALVSGAALGLGLMTKYTAILLVGLQAAWVLVYARHLRGVKLLAVAWAVGALLFAASATLVQWRYGVNHLTASSDVVLHWPTAGKIMILLVFLSGVSIMPVFLCARFAFAWRTATFAAFALLAAAFASSWGGVTVATSLWLALWLVSGVAMTILVVRTIARWNNRDDVFLGCWFALFVVMMSVVMPWSAGRYCLIAIPAVIFSAVRCFERAPRARAWLVGSLVVVLALSGCLAYADYQEAQAGRRIVTSLKAAQLFDGPHRFYFADAFNMTYMERAGWQPCGDPSSLQAGDLILAPERSLPMAWFLRSHPSVKLVRSFEYPTRFPFRVMDNPSDAGFYASAWGPLPFSVTKGPWERFDLFEIIPAS